MRIIFLALLSLLFAPSLYATTFTYDSLHRLTSVTHDNGDVTTYSYDAGGNLLSTQTAALPAISSIGINLNGTAFNSRTNKTMTLTATTIASAPVTNADVYIALQLPNGTLLVMQPGGGFGTALTPLLSGVPVPNFAGPIFSYTFTGVEPSGTYKWFAALTTPGTLQVIGTLAVASFNYMP